MTFPPMNHVLVLWSWLQTLLLPLELHSFTLALARNLEISFSYDPIPTPHRTLLHPENRLAALLLIATKLLHPPDSTDRFPRRPTDPSALSLHWPTWTRAFSARPARGSAFRTAMATKQSDVLHMSPAQIDDFLALFRALHPRRNDKGAGRAFPEQPPGPELPPVQRVEWQPAPLEEVVGAMRPVRVVVGRDVEVDRPGSGYARFKTEGELKGYAKELYAAVAECVGMEVGTLVRDVFAVERKLDLMREQEDTSGHGSLDV